MTNIRHRVTVGALSLFGVLASFYAFQLIGCIASASAAADTPAPAVTPGSIAGSTATWLLGAMVVLKLVEMVLDRIAPLTQTKLDDEALAAIHTVRETAEEILAHVKPPPAILAVLLLGAGLALQPSCATTKAAPDAAKHAVVDCARANAAAVLAEVAEYGAAAIATGHIDWTAVEAAARTQGVAIGGCAVSAFVAALAKQRPADVAARSTGPDAVAEGRATLERLRAGWGGVEWTEPR